MDEPTENVLRISHLREVLGFACQQVALTGEPIIVQRYNRQDVILVPLADWRCLQRIEAAIRDGRLPWTDGNHGRGGIDGNLGECGRG